MPVDVALSQWIGVGGCVCLSSCNVSLVVLAYFELKNIAPSYASASDATKKFSIWHSVNIAPLRWTGCLSCGFRPRKKCPSDRLLASLSDKYDAYEWMFMIIPDA